jgi:hypothetical protein
MPCMVEFGYASVGGGVAGVPTEIEAHEGQLETHLI